MSWMWLIASMAPVLTAFNAVGDSGEWLCSEPDSHLGYMIDTNRPMIWTWGGYVPVSYESLGVKIEELPGEAASELLRVRVDHPPREMATPTIPSGPSIPSDPSVEYDVQPLLPDAELLKRSTVRPHEMMSEPATETFVLRDLGAGQVELVVTVDPPNVETWANIAGHSLNCVDRADE